MLIVHADYHRRKLASLGFVNGDGKGLAEVVHVSRRNTHDSPVEPDEQTVVAGRARNGTDIPVEDIQVIIVSGLHDPVSWKEGRLGRQFIIHAWIEPATDAFIQFVRPVILSSVPGPDILPGSEAGRDAWSRARRKSAASGRFPEHHVEIAGHPMTCRTKEPGRP